MNKYDFSGSLTNLTGEIVKSPDGKALPLAEMMTSAFLNKTPGLDIGKAVGFATQLYTNQNILQVDDTDKKKIQDMLNTGEVLKEWMPFNLIINALLQIFDTPIKEPKADLEKTTEGAPVS